MNTNSSDQSQIAINSYLMFRLGEEFFAINVGNVLNILELTKITKVPHAPVFMKGVINLRGSVLPLIDTRIKFGMTETVYSTNTCILVLELHNENEHIKVGALADSVQEVLEIPEHEIMPPPSLGTRYKSAFIKGMFKMENDFVMILNVNDIFSSDEVVNIQEITNPVKQTAQ